MEGENMIYFQIAFGISALTIILGFIALITQKIYIDNNTNKPCEINIPIVGRMKTNYPALVFLFLGFALAVLTIYELPETPETIEVYRALPKEIWNITGTLEIGGNKSIDYASGQLTLFPSDISIEISRGGKFNLKVGIEEGKSFEDAFPMMDYTHSEGSMTFDTKGEYKKYKENNSNSYVKNALDHNRIYKKIYVVPK